MTARPLAALLLVFAALPAGASEWTVTNATLRRDGTADTFLVDLNDTPAEGHEVNLLEWTVDGAASGSQVVGDGAVLPKSGTGPDRWTLYLEFTLRVDGMDGDEAADIWVDLYSAPESDPDGELGWGLFAMTDRDAMPIIPAEHDGEEHRYAVKIEMGERSGAEDWDWRKVKLSLFLRSFWENAPKEEYPIEAEFFLAGTEEPLTPTPTPTDTPVPPTATATPTPTSTNTPDPTITPSPTPVPPTNTPTDTPTPTPTDTPVPSDTPTMTPTIPPATPPPTPTNTHTPTETHTPTATSTPTNTPDPTHTATPTPTNPATPTPYPTATATNTPWANPDSLCPIDLWDCYGENARMPWDIIENQLMTEEDAVGVFAKNGLVTRCNALMRDAEIANSLVVGGTMEVCDTAYFDDSVWIRNYLNGYDINTIIASALTPGFKRVMVRGYTDRERQYADAGVVGDTLTLVSSDGSLDIRAYHGSRTVDFRLGSDLLDSVLENIPPFPTPVPTRVITASGLASATPLGATGTNIHVPAPTARPAYDYEMIEDASGTGTAVRPEAPYNIRRWTAERPVVLDATSAEGMDEVDLKLQDAWFYERFLARSGDYEMNGPVQMASNEIKFGNQISRKIDLYGPNNPNYSIWVDAFAMTQYSGRYHNFYQYDTSENGVGYFTIDLGDSGLGQNFGAAMVNTRSASPAFLRVQSGGGDSLFQWGDGSTRWSSGMNGGDDTWRLAYNDDDLSNHAIKVYTGHRVEFPSNRVDFSRGGELVVINDNTENSGILISDVDGDGLPIIKFRNSEDVAYDAAFTLTSDDRLELLQSQLRVADSNVRAGSFAVDVNSLGTKIHYGWNIYRTYIENLSLSHESDRYHRFYNDTETADPAVEIDADARSLEVQHLKGIHSIQMVADETNDATTLKNDMEEGEIRLWKPGGQKVSLAIKYDGDLNESVLVAYSDRIPGATYPLAIREEDEVWLAEGREYD